MDKWRGKVALVTGASSGIGAAVARALVHHGMVVVGLARRLERVQDIAKDIVEAKEPGKLIAIKADMRKEEDILKAFSWAEDQLGGVDVLVNNAGVFHTSYLSEGKTEDWRDMLEVNVLAVCICTREYLKSMERRNNQQGHIVIISSIAAHIAEYPKINMYCSTKHAVHAIGSCLRRELAEKKSNIKVTEISPGPVATEIFEGTDFLEASKSLPILESEDVAASVVHALSAPPVAQICDIVLNNVPTLFAFY
ncbi:farnesol dehydrogenase-like [Homalodisca vitripennis]|uniref:farnesol dehydrogenase-like n=1 Tax=Homalodisca vitripennis TaxID=197043 RepID=UPI001EEC0B84|nr:farnesol dehydrogenase-like [Homalodisca vitripennis]